MVRLIERSAVIDTNEHVLETMAFPSGIVDVIGRHVTYAQFPGQFHKMLAKLPVLKTEVILQLDKEVTFAEDVEIFPGSSQSLLHVSGEEAGLHLAFPASRKTKEVA